MVNINDFESEESKEIQCKLSEMFERQRNLMIKYGPIEKSNGLVHMDAPVNIDDRLAQQRMKDFAWRFTEEMTEATQALMLHPEIVDHFKEELSDATHFLIELMILADVKVEDITDNMKDYDAYDGDAMDLIQHQFGVAIVPDLSLNNVSLLQYKVITELGIAMNFLKNKPWKQSHMLTDENRFHTQLETTFFEFILMMFSFGIGSEEIYDLYTRKNKVNQFRQDSKY